MKLIFVDTEKTLNIYTEDNPYCQVRIIFEDDGDQFVYYSDDVNRSAYINKIINKNKMPHPFFISNFEVISDEEQYKTYDDWIQNMSNFQAVRQDEKIDGNIRK